MSYDRLWERLLEHLAEFADVREVAEGLEVTFWRAGEPRTVVVVVDEEEWDDYVTTIFGTGDPARTPLRAELLDMPADAGYLVHTDTYDWVPSTTPTLPVPADRPSGPGEWFVLDEAGRVVSRFADFPDQG